MINAFFGGRRHPAPNIPLRQDCKRIWRRGYITVTLEPEILCVSSDPPLRHARGYAPCYPRLEITKPNSPKHLMDCMAHWRECTHPLRRWPTGWAKPHKDCNITYVSETSYKCAHIIRTLTVNHTNFSHRAVFGAPPRRFPRQVADRCRQAKLRAKDLSTMIKLMKIKFGFAPITSGSLIMPFHGTPNSLW